MEQDQPRAGAARESPAVGVLDQQRAETQRRWWLRSLLNRIGYCGLLRHGSGRAQCERRDGRKHQRRHRGGTRIGLRGLVGRAVFRAARIVLRMRGAMALGRHHLRASAGQHRALRSWQHAHVCGHRHLLEQQAKQRHPDPQDATMAAAKRQAHGCRHFNPFRFDARHARAMKSHSHWLTYFSFRGRRSKVTCGAAPLFAATRRYPSIQVRRNASWRRSRATIPSP